MNTKPANQLKARYTLLRAARMFDGSGSPALKDAAVLVDGRMIVATGPKALVRAPDGADVHVADYSNATIMPGLVDAHTHLMAPGDGTHGDEVAKDSVDALLLRAAKNANTFLRAGVTTARENGAKNAVAFSLKDGIQRGLVDGPTLVVCGRPVTITGGHMWFCGSEADGVEGVRREVRRLLKEGADFIKLMATGGSTKGSQPLRPSYSVEELRAAVDEAHRADRLTAAHCASVKGIENCIEAGVDMIIHCVYEDEHGVYRFRQDLAERLAAANAWVNPTLHVVQSGIDLAEERSKTLDGLSAAQKSALDVSKASLEHRVEATRRMAAMGIRMTAGSDSPWGAYPPGEFVKEIEFLARAGLSNVEALLSGTSAAADSIAVGDRAGRIAPGRPADLLVVGGDPVNDLGSLWDVKDVYKAGQRVERGGA